MAMEVLGTNRPFGTELISWLWERKDDLSGMLLLVPTAQSGRRIRQGLAERGGSLAPFVVTPGFFLQTTIGASESVEILAWVEVLEAVTDWSAYQEAFPQAPNTQEGAGWATALGKSLTRMRMDLIEGGLTVRSAAARMKGSIEEARWENLQRLEAKVEKKLSEWGVESRSGMIENHEFSWPENVKEIVLAGAVDLSPVAIRFLEKAPVPVRILVADEKDLDQWGRPNENWIQSNIPWPRVTLAGDARQQADAALAQVAQVGRPSHEVALGSADEEVTAELVRSFGRAGWSLYHPGGQRLPTLASWLSAWRKYLSHSEAAEVMDLLSFSQTGPLVKHRRVKRARALSRLRNGQLVRTRADVTRARLLLEKECQAAAGTSREKYLASSVEDALLSEETMAELAHSRDRFLRSGFHQGMRDLLDHVDPQRESGAEEWLIATEAIAEKVKRSTAFWLDLLQSSLAPIPDPLPEERVLDVQGWLELFFEPGKHLVICGMNEGLVPTRPSVDSWLPEATRRRLNLSTNESRHARDAYLLSCMMKAREQEGQVDLLLGKSTGNGDVLQPSRLLLAAEGEELARRVKTLFREVSPPEDGLSWSLNDAWKWSVARDERPEKLSVTGFSDYLACPFRFYLKHVKKMQAPDPERGEWNARDFGNLMHDVLENFGNDESARLLSESGEIEAWLHQELARQLRERLGEELPVAVRIQAEVMRQRLTWFSHKQAREFNAGWRITEVERSFELPIGGLIVRGQIDRIERQESSGICRVLDYKTSSQRKLVANAHGVEVRAHHVWPEHLKGVDEVKAFLPVGRAGKVVEARWTNLQVALYAAAHGEVPEVGYFALGASESQVELSMWPDFGEAEIESALACAEWIAKQVREAKDPFWPPAEKVQYDDYESLRFGKELQEVVR